MGIGYWEVRAYQYLRFTRIFQVIRREEHLASRYESSSPGSIPSVLVFCDDGFCRAVRLHLDGSGLWEPSSYSWYSPHLCGCLGKLATNPYSWVVARVLTFLNR